MDGHLSIRDQFTKVGNRRAALFFPFQVKVSIYNNDVEKAFIVFNATGADKMGWFTDSRIIRSSWSDLKTAKKQLVSMAG